MLQRVPVMANAPPFSDVERETLVAACEQFGSSNWALVTEVVNAAVGVPERRRTGKGGFFLCGQPINGAL